MHLYLKKRKKTTAGADPCSGGGGRLPQPWQPALPRLRRRPAPAVVAVRTPLCGGGAPLGPLRGSGGRLPRWRRPARPSPRLPRRRLAPARPSGAAAPRSDLSVGVEDAVAEQLREALLVVGPLGVVGEVGLEDVLDVGGDGGDDALGDAAPHPAVRERAAGPGQRRRSPVVEVVEVRKERGEDAEHWPQHRRAGLGGPAAPGRAAGEQHRRRHGQVRRPHVFPQEAHRHGHEPARPPAAAALVRPSALSPRDKAVGEMRGRE
ncbi:hypothetical protein PVAP13_3KG119454 [Panicum virgatum]|uniref:Uncharacterized protein n=1 Tax=Panicum virgatum TaxID=38727 RepID=A0A8T0UNQ9_PANVG|nr:hypothetical protein PVAP13_3KG119454 [Panicum virgatum]